MHDRAGESGRGVLKQSWRKLGVLGWGWGDDDAFVKNQILTHNLITISLLVHALTCDFVKPNMFMLPLCPFISIHWHLFSDHPVN